MLTIRSRRREKAPGLNRESSPAILAEEGLLAAFGAVVVVATHLNPGYNGVLSGSYHAELYSASPKNLRPAGENRL